MFVFVKGDKIRKQNRDAFARVYMQKVAVFVGECRRTARNVCVSQISLRVCAAAAAAATAAAAAADSLSRMSARAFC